MLIIIAWLFNYFILQFHSSVSVRFLMSIFSFSTSSLKFLICSSLSVIHSVLSKSSAYNFSISLWQSINNIAIMLCSWVSISFSPLHGQYIWPCGFCFYYNSGLLWFQFWFSSASSLLFPCVKDQFGFYWNSLFLL